MDKDYILANEIKLTMTVLSVTSSHWLIYHDIVLEIEWKGIKET